MTRQLTSIVLGIAISCAPCGCADRVICHAVAPVRQESLVSTSRRTVRVQGRGRARGRGVQARLGAARAARIDAFRNVVARAVIGPANRCDGVVRVRGRIAGCKEVSSVWDEARNEYRVTLECPALLPPDADRNRNPERRRAGRPTRRSHP